MSYQGSGRGTQYPPVVTTASAPVTIAAAATDGYVTSGDPYPQTYASGGTPHQPTIQSFAANNHQQATPSSGLTHHRPGPNFPPEFTYPIAPPNNHFLAPPNIRHYLNAPPTITSAYHGRRSAAAAAPSNTVAGPSTSTKQGAPPEGSVATPFGLPNSPINLRPKQRKDYVLKKRPLQEEIDGFWKFSKYENKKQAFRLMNTVFHKIEGELSADQEAEMQAALTRAGEESFAITRQGK